MWFFADWINESSNEYGNGTYKTAQDQMRMGCVSAMWACLLVYYTHIVVGQLQADWFKGALGLGVGYLGLLLFLWIYFIRFVVPLNSGNAMSQWWGICGAAVWHFVSTWFVLIIAGYFLYDRYAFGPGGRWLGPFLTMWGLSAAVFGPVVYHNVLPVVILLQGVNRPINGLVAPSGENVMTGMAMSGDVPVGGQPALNAIWELLQQTGNSDLASIGTRWRAQANAALVAQDYRQAAEVMEAFRENIEAWGKTQEEGLRVQHTLMEIELRIAKVSEKLKRTRGETGEELQTEMERHKAARAAEHAGIHIDMEHHEKQRDMVYEKWQRALKKIEEAEMPDSMKKDRKKRCNRYYQQLLDNLEECG